jgi:hypothetical protein
VEYGEGFNKILFEIAYISNGVWQPYQVWTPGREDRLLAPHEVVNDSIHVPGDDDLFKVGLHITTLTWRGRLALRLSESRISRYLKPLTGFLIVQDEKKRSTVEWSEVHNVKGSLMEK